MTPNRLWLTICVIFQIGNLVLSYFFARPWLWRWKGLGWLPELDKRTKLLEDCKRETRNAVVRDQAPDWQSFQARVDEHFEWVGDRLRNQATVALALGLLFTLIFIAIVLSNFSGAEQLTAASKVEGLLADTQQSLQGTLAGVFTHLIIVFVLLYPSEHVFQGWSRDFMEALRREANEVRAAIMTLPPSRPSSSPVPDPSPNRPSIPPAPPAPAKDAGDHRPPPVPQNGKDGDPLRAVEGAMTDVHHELHRFPGALADEIERTASKLGEAFGREARHAQWETLDKTQRQIDRLLVAADERDQKFVNHMTTLVHELVRDLSSQLRSEQASQARSSSRRKLSRESQAI